MFMMFFTTNLSKVLYYPRSSLRATIMQKNAQTAVDHEMDGPPSSCS